jgi:uncharacterized protein YdgA (DUF945 family)
MEGPRSPCLWQSAGRISEAEGISNEEMEKIAREMTFSTHQQIQENRLTQMTVSRDHVFIFW